MEEYPELHIVIHERNLGLGKALESGFAIAKEDIIVTMDADCTHDPSLIPVLVKALNNADVAIASRYVSGGGMQGVPWYRQALSVAGNRVLSTVLKWPVNDGTSGYRAYRKDCLKELGSLLPGFEVQAEILSRLRNKKICEVPMNLKNRPAGHSKMKYSALIWPYLNLTLGR